MFGTFFVDTDGARNPLGGVSTRLCIKWLSWSV